MEKIASRDPPRRAYRPADLAREFGGSVGWWRQQVKCGELAGCKLGRRTLLILAKDLDDFLERKRRGSRTGA